MVSLQLVKLIMILNSFPIKEIEFNSEVCVQHPEWHSHSLVWQMSSAWLKAATGMNTEVQNLYQPTDTHVSTGTEFII